MNPYWPQVKPHRPRQTRWFASLAAREFGKRRGAGVRDGVVSAEPQAERSTTPASTDNLEMPSMPTKGRHRARFWQQLRPSKTIRPAGCHFSFATRSDISTLRGHLTAVPQLGGYVIRLTAD